MNSLRGNIAINGKDQASKLSFKKPALSIEAHIVLWKKRGLIIKNELKVKEYLTHISYYRLSGYSRLFYIDDKHNFRKGTTFEQILDLYAFDRKLKIQLIDMLERIEISFKTAMVNCLSETYGPHWFMDAKHFATSAAANNTFKIIEEELVKNKDNVFIKHYNQTYSSPKYPPSWMLFQLFSFGGVGNIYKSLSKTNKSKVAKTYDLNFYVLESWIDCLSYLRNLCAHSDRVWNRRMTKKLGIRGFEEYFPQDNKGGYSIDRLYSYILVIAFLLKKISPDSNRFEEFKKFFNQEIKLKKLDISRMGFINDWNKTINKFILGTKAK